MARVVILSDNYDELRAQAAALLMRVNTQEELTCHWQRLANSLTKRLAMVDYDSLSAERETNAILTARVEELEKRLVDEPHGRIERISRDLGNCAEGWDAEARLLGNVTAEEIRDLCRWVQLCLTSR